MTLVLDATPNGASANAYLTRAEANAYFEGRTATATWDALSDADKDRAIVDATMRLEQEMFLGFPATTTQALQWPRGWLWDGRTWDMYDTGAAWDANGRPLPLDAVPAAVKNACCEMILARLSAAAAAAVATSSVGLGALKSIRVGPITVEPSAVPPGHTAAQYDLLPSAVRRLLSRYLLSGDGNTRLVREDY